MIEKLVGTSGVSGSLGEHYSDTKLVNKINEIIEFLEKKFPEDFNPKVELLPCPFCGEKPNVVNQSNIGYGWVVRCNNINCRVNPNTIDCQSEEDAINAWNRRVTNEID